MFLRGSKILMCINQTLRRVPTSTRCAKISWLQGLKVGPVVPSYIATNTVYTNNINYVVSNNSSQIKLTHCPYLPTFSNNFSHQVKGQSTHYNPSGLVLHIKNVDDANRFCTELWEGIRSRVVPENSAGEKALENLEKLILLLNDLKCDTRNIFGLVSANPRILNCNWNKFHSVVMFLTNVGLRGNNVLRVLNHRDIWMSEIGRLSERVNFLRRVGIVEGDVQRLVCKCPKVLTLKKGKLNAIMNMLKDSGFKREQIIVIINESPNIFETNLDEIEYLFQYVYFRMGLTDHRQMVQAKLFRHSIEHVRQRHLFLLRLGHYETPNVRSQTTSINPKLHIIIDTSLNRFCKMFQVTSVDEFTIFCQELMEESDYSDDNHEDSNSDYDSDNSVNTK